MITNMKHSMTMKKTYYLILLSWYYKIEIDVRDVYQNYLVVCPYTRRSIIAFWFWSILCYEEVPSCRFQLNLIFLEKLGIVEYETIVYITIQKKNI